MFKGSVIMRIIVKKSNGGEWYGIAINKSFEVKKIIGNKYYEVILEPPYVKLLNGNKIGYVYTSDAEVI